MNRYPCFLTFLLIASAFQTLAQFRHPVRYAIIVGMNKQEYQWSEGYSGSEPRTDIMVGLQVEKNLNLFMGVGTGLHFLRSGWDSEGYIFEFAGDVFAEGSSLWDNSYIVVPVQYTFFPISPLILGIGTDFRFLIKSKLAEEHVFYDDSNGQYSAYFTSVDVTRACARIEPHVALIMGMKIKRFSITYRATWSMVNRYPRNLTAALSDRQAAGSYMVERNEAHQRLSESNNQFVLSFKIN